MGKIGEIILSKLIDLLAEEIGNQRLKFLARIKLVRREGVLMK